MWDNDPCHIAGELAEHIEAERKVPVRRAPFHPHSKNERLHHADLLPVQPPAVPII
jgi:hypothetical protein